MNFNWAVIGDKIFGILKGSGFKLQMFDKSGNKTLDPHEATRFFATIASNDPELKEYSILIGLHDENRDSHLDIKTPNLKNEKDFDTIKQLKTSLQRNIGEREGLSVNWYKFDHAIKPKDDLVNNITESKDISKPFGSTKSSYQKIGNSKLIIRHTDTVNEEKKGSRWRHVKAIFVENGIGERLKYPHMHIAGARAIARHFSNNGTMNDEIGEAIQKLSSDYMDLKKAGRMLRSAGDESKTVVLGEVLRDINKKVKRLSGPRGYASLSDSLKSQCQTETSGVYSIYETLLELCGCDRNSVDAAALQTAARYLNDAPMQNVTVQFKVKPDLTSKAADYADQKDRLAWQVSQLAEAVADDDLQSKLAVLADALKAHRVVDPADVDLIRMVFKASKGVKDQEVTEPEIDRIKQLSGL